MTSARRHLRNISEIRSFFRTNDEPIYFVGPTGFNLLGLDRWVRHFNYITYYDAWDGAHPRMITPKPVGTWSSPRPRTSSTFCSATRKCRSAFEPKAAGRGSPRSSSTRKPRRSARSSATS